MNTEPKIILALVLYFVLLSFLITIVLGVVTHYNLTNEGFNSTGGSMGINQYDIGSGNPRFTTGIIGGSESLFSPKVLHDVSPVPFLQAGYIVDDVTCEEYEGFSWGQFSFFGLALGSETCRGSLNMSYYDPNSTWDRGNTFATYSNDYVCDLPLLSTSRQLAERMGCTWYTGDLSLDFGITESKTVFSNLWSSLKQMFTLQLNFGFSNTIISGILNFLLIIFPLLMLTMYVIIFGRKIIGIT